LGLFLLEQLWEHVEQLWEHLGQLGKLWEHLDIDVEPFQELERLLGK